MEEHFSKIRFQHIHNFASIRIVLAEYVMRSYNACFQLCISSTNKKTFSQIVALENRLTSVLKTRKSSEEIVLMSHTINFSSSFVLNRKEWKCELSRFDTVLSRNSEGQRPKLIPSKRSCKATYHSVYSKYCTFS